jgi:hypothetical protein
MTDSVDDRLSKRFGNDENGQNEKNGGNEVKDRNGDPEQNGERDVNGAGTGGWGANNVKDEWTARSIYLPDTIDSDLSRTFKQMDLALDMAEINREFRKTRHFYPVLVALGIERMGEMEPVELMAFLDELQEREQEAVDGERSADT